MSIYKMHKCAYNLVSKERLFKNYTIYLKVMQYITPQSFTKFYIY